MVKSGEHHLNRQTLDRLMQYYQCLKDEFTLGEEGMVSSAVLASLLGFDGSQVRKDLSTLGIKGQPHVGFHIHNTLDAIRDKLGFSKIHNAVVIGAGRLGGALGSYQGFQEYALKIVALFDSDPNKIGLLIGGHVVQPLDQLDLLIKQMDVKVGILTVPSIAGQESANRLIKTGIKVIWSFTSSRIRVPDNVFVRNERLYVALGQLFYHLE